MKIHGENFVVMHSAQRVFIANKKFLNNVLQQEYHAGVVKGKVLVITKPKIDVSNFAI